jgi:hypothetical protein
MKLHPRCWEELDKLILVAAHAVYAADDFSHPERDESWILKKFQKGEPACYIDHIHFGVELSAKYSNALLVFSGGQTCYEAGPRSEGQSYWLLANHFSWWDRTHVRERATTEEFACDSYENLLFGIARFRECTGHFPNSIEIVGWRFKSERFDFHRQTIRWPGSDGKFQYHGINDPSDAAASAYREADVLASFKKDPYGIQGELSNKRIMRNPFNRRNPHVASCPEITGLLNTNMTDGREALACPLPWDSPLSEGT